MEFSQATISSIAQSTALNHPTAGYILAAETLGATDLAEALRKFDLEHMRRGSLTLDDSAKRYGLYQELLAVARQKMSPAGFKAFYNAT